MSKLYAGLVFILICLTPHAQANEDVFISEEWDRVIIVDPSQPSSPPEDTSRQTIKRTVAEAVYQAFDNRLQDLSTHIIIKPGVYREQIRVIGRWQGAAPILIEGGEGVILSGSDVWGGWETDQQNPQIYTRRWPYDWGYAPNPWESFGEYAQMQPIVQRREMVFVDGILLKQVLTRPELEEGTFFVDEAADRIWMWPYATVNMRTALVEVAVRPELLFFDGVSNVGIKGITFQHAASIADGAPLGFWGCQNILIEDSAFLWNNWKGVFVRECADVRIVNSRMDNNGDGGMTIQKINGLVVENVSARRNNWRGALAEWRGWSSGQKFLNIHGGVIRNFIAEDNASIGLWLDYDNVDVVVEGARLCRNYAAGILIEANVGPITVRDSEICANYAEDNFAGGLYVTHSENITLQNNLIYANEAAQIRVREENPFRTVTNWETQESVEATFRNWTLTGNTIVSFNNEQRLLWLPSRETYEGIVRSVANKWYIPNDGLAVQLDDMRLSWADWSARSGFTVQENSWGLPDIASIRTLLNAFGQSGLMGYYYDSANFDGNAVIRKDAKIDFGWFGQAPIQPINPRVYSVKWSGMVEAQETALHTFYLRATDSVQLQIGDELIIDSVSLNDQPVRELMGQIFLEAGKRYPIHIKFQEFGSTGYLRLYWSNPYRPKQVVPSWQFYP